jgi:site-specific DNA-adenine methylase
MSFSILRYPSGKSKSRAILPLLSTSTPGLEYREPIVGGGSVGLDVIVRPDYWLNDSDPGISALWQAVVRNPIEQTHA